MKGNNVDEVCKELGFDISMQEYITDIESIHDKVFEKVENLDCTMIRRIKDRMNNISDGVDIRFFSEREKFLYAFGMLNAIIFERMI